VTALAVTALVVTALALAAAAGLPLPPSVVTLSQAQIARIKG
jgi:hypothetical protein